jgi:hypothetical protein
MSLYNSLLMIDMETVIEKGKNMLSSYTIALTTEEALMHDSSTSQSIFTGSHISPAPLPSWITPHTPPPSPALFPASFHTPPSLTCSILIHTTPYLMGHSRNNGYIVK